MVATSTRVPSGRPMRTMKIRRASRKWTTCPQCDFPIDVLWNDRYCRHCGCDNTSQYLRFPARLKRKPSTTAVSTRRWGAWSSGH